MDTRYDFDAVLAGSDAAPIVYVRPMRAEDLPPEVKAQIGGQGTVYSVHDAQGGQLALVRDRKLAFVLARQNNYAPVGVH